MVTLWNFTDSEPLEYNDLLTSDASVCDFTKDESYAIIGSKKGTLIVWNYDQNKTIATFKGHMNQCSAIGVPKDNEANLLASGSRDTNVKLWDMRTKKSVGTFKGHEDLVTCVDLSPDNQYIASSSLDGTVKIWDT
jgi:katanin p80 WD40 repeat-containing subunit B1